MSPGGLIADARGIAAVGLRMVRTRLELAGIELQEEKARIARQALAASATIFLALIGTLLALSWLVLALPEAYRHAALGTLGIAFLAAAGACAGWLVRGEPRPVFEATLRHLARDEAALKGGDG